MMLWRRMMLFAVSVMLGACSSMRIVDNEVRSFGQTPPPAPQSHSYQLQRLLSQKNETFDPIAQAVNLALTKLGLHEVSKNPDWVATVHWTEQQLPRAPWEPAPSPFEDLIWLNSGGAGVGLSWRYPAIDLPWYERSLSLILRDARSDSVVFETQVRHDGRWSDTAAVLPAMLQAALHDYPQGQPTLQIFNIEIPR